HPDDTAAFDQRIRLQLDLLAEPALGRLGGHVDALAGDVVLPAVIGTAQPALLVTAEPERDAAVRAELVDEAEASLRIAERDHAFAEKPEPHGWAVGPGQLLAEERRQPVAPEELAHRGAGIGANQELAVLCFHGKGMLLLCG